MLIFVSQNHIKTMKKYLALLPFFCLIMVGVKVFGRNSDGQPVEGKLNYVVIGAFSIPKNAIEFAESAKKKKLEAQFSINPLRKLFYVYVLQTDDQSAAFEEAKKLRKDTPYYDTWVFTGTLGDENKSGADLNPLTGKSIKTIEAVDVKETLPGMVPPVQENKMASASQNPVAISGQQPTDALIEEVPEGSKKFLFKISTHEREIDGDVDVMDLDKAKLRKAASYRGNDVIAIRPVNNSGNIALVCEVFGYRKMQQILNFNAPQPNESVVVDETKITVSFELVRLKKGDFAVMYNVYFFKDAAVMRPESHYEVTSLLEMLQENPKYKIKIHGHTNGNASGKIISMGESKNFFALTDTKEGHGSAKRLSEERAKVIQNYLIAQGIDPTRMQIKAWGGKRPVYDEDSQQAHANVRVEIEILED